MDNFDFDNFIDDDIEELINANIINLNINKSDDKTILPQQELVNSKIDITPYELEFNQAKIGGKESKGNFRNFSYSKKDQYYRKAKEEGFRARSVYKLKEINQNFNLLSDVKNILDLCAAPGSWSQMLRASADENAKICAVDLQSIVHIEGVHTIQGDITKQSTLELILKYFNQEKVDLVVFDGAPDVTGILEIDIDMQNKLITCSLIMCLKLLNLNGKFVAKVFKSDEHDFYYDKTKTIFNSVSFYKPSSSRLTSNETFIVAKGFYLSDNIAKEILDMTLEEVFDIGTNVICDVKNSKYSMETIELISNLFNVMI